MRFGIARAGTRGDFTPPSPSSISSDEVMEFGQQVEAMRQNLEDQTGLTELEKLLEGSSPRRSYADVVRGSPSIGSSTANSKMSISSAYITAEDGLSCDTLSSMDISSTASTGEFSNRTSYANHGSPATRTMRNNRWTKEQSEDTYFCYYIAKLKKLPITSGTHQIWRSRNPSIFPYIDANKLNTYRRFYEKKMSIDEKKLIENRAEIFLHAQPTQTSVTTTGSNTISTFISETTTTLSNTQDTTQNCPTSTQDLDNLSATCTNLAQKLYDDILTSYHLVKQTKLEDRNTIKKYNHTKHAHELDAANCALSRIISDFKITTLDDINSLQYATGSVLAGNIIPLPNPRQTQRQPRNPYKKIQRSIFKIRQLIGRLTSAINLTIGKKGKRKLNKLLKGQSYQDRLQVERMKLAALTKKIRTLKQKKERFINNKKFMLNRKRFFNELRESNSKNVTSPPTKSNIETFWKNILSTPSVHNTEASWILNEETAQSQTHQDAWTNITVELFNKAISKLSNWKAPGIDKVNNFWIKKLHSTHSSMRNALNHICLHPEKTPYWLTKGTTTLIYKKGLETEPSNYRPITCLPTTYKLLTLILAEKIYQHLTDHRENSSPILQFEQKGCRKKARGCKDQLLIDKCIAKTGNKTTINFSWIDFKKAYDSIPHSWIEKILQLYKIDPITKQFITHAMKHWNTTLNLHHSKGTIKTTNIPIRCGIFQGDSLSPLIFCMCLFPLTNMLNRTKIGVRISNQNHTRINHLLYMDDMKIYANGTENMKRLLTLIQTFSMDINMSLNLNKCATLTINKGVVENDTTQMLPLLTKDESYKYLGLLQSSNFHEKKIKIETKNEYFERVRKILKKNLNAINTAQAITIFAVPIIRYTIGIIHWTETELHNIDRKTRKILTKFKFHHPLSDVHNLYISREKGGRGIPNIYNIHSQEMSKLAVYLQSSNDPFLKQVKHFEACATPSKTILRYQPSGPKYRDKLKCDYENIQLRNRKPLYGKFFQLEQNIPSIHLSKSRLWLKQSYLRFETESLICAAQEQALLTNWKRYVCKMNSTSPKCRLCNSYDETVMHITSGCPMLASNLYTNRHNKIASYIHWCILNDIGAPTEKLWYKHKPTHSIDKNNHTIMWDLPIITDARVPHNQPDIIIHDRTKKTCLIIDIAVPQEINVIKKTAEKIRKYKQLEIEIQRCWNLQRVQTIPIIIGALGTVTKSIEKYIETISPNINFSILQKTALIGTQNIIRNVLSPSSISHSN